MPWLLVLLPIRLWVAGETSQRKRALCWVLKGGRILTTKAMKCNKIGGRRSPGGPCLAETSARSCLSRAKADGVQISASRGVSPREVANWRRYLQQILLSRHLSVYLRLKAWECELTKVFGVDSKLERGCDRRIHTSWAPPVATWPFECGHKQTRSSKKTEGGLPTYWKITSNCEKQMSTWEVMRRVETVASQNNLNKQLKIQLFLTRNSDSMRR